MNPAPIGTRIQIISNTNFHNYRVGNFYRVHEVDGDGTFKAIDDLGVEGDFLRWSDCRPGGIGWEWLRSQLDARSLDLLSAFDGVENLSLREDVETIAVRSIPNLADAIVNLLPAVDEERERMENAPPPDDGNSGAFKNIEL